MKRRDLFVLVTMVSAAGLGIGFGAHAAARPSLELSGCAPLHPRWEGQRVPVEPTVEAPPTSATPPRPAAPRAQPATTESAYDACRRSYFEHAKPYDFYACDLLR